MFMSSLTFFLLFDSLVKQNLQKMLPMLYGYLPRTPATIPGKMSLHSVESISATNVFQGVNCDACDQSLTVYFSLFTVTSIHSIQEK